MKLTAFSDTHGHHRKITLPQSDIFIFAGDAMTCGYKEQELIDFLAWYDKQDAEHKILVAGNHDRWIERHRGMFQDLLKYYPSIIYLEDSGVVLYGLNIWGTPHSKHFCGWAFNRSDYEMEHLFSHIPEDVDILVSHAPQYGILDQLERGERVGEKTLTDRIEKTPGLRRHIFGHIHCQYGQQESENYKSMNVSVILSSENHVLLLYA